MTGNDSDNYLDASNDSFSMLSKISIELNIFSLYLCDICGYFHFYDFFSFQFF